MCMYRAWSHVDVRRYMFPVRFLLQISWLLEGDNLIPDEGNVLDVVLHRVSLDQISIAITALSSFKLQPSIRNNELLSFCTVKY